MSRLFPVNLWPHVVPNRQQKLRGLGRGFEYEELSFVELQILGFKGWGLYRLCKGDPEAFYSPASRYPGRGASCKKLNAHAYMSTIFPTQYLSLGRCLESCVVRHIQGAFHFEKWPASPRQKEKSKQGCTTSS